MKRLIEQVKSTRGRRPVAPQMKKTRGVRKPLANNSLGSHGDNHLSYSKGKTERDAILPYESNSRPRKRLMRKK